MQTRMNGQQQHNPLADQEPTPPPVQQPLVPQGQVSGMIVFGPAGPQIVETSAINQGLAFGQSKLPSTPSLIRSIQRSLQRGDVVRIEERFIVEET